jgi:hypothetical protein
MNQVTNNVDEFNTKLHVGGFTYDRQPLDILISFLIYFIWMEQCWKNFKGEYSSDKILHQA